MRYSDDVINAEKWNAGLKKRLLPAKPDEDKLAEHQNKTIQKKEAAPITDEQPADENLQVSTPDVIRISKMNTSPVSTNESRNRKNRKKKRGMFLLSGLLTGLASRPRNHK